MKSFKVKIYGRVQGVGFRYFTQMKAIELSILGTVQNLADGTVFIFCSGEDESIMNFLQWIHKGPQSSVVDKLEYEEVELNGMEDFKIIR